MKTAFKVIGILMISALVMTSCKKYDNGGPLRKAEKNITNTWKIDSYYMDGVDNTSSLLITNFTETFADGGVYTRIYNDASGDPKNESGSWDLESDKSLINMSGTGSYELTGQTSTVSASDYTILKLTKDELWYEFANGGSTHEFHLSPN
ncbi:MAG: hypothetical protein JKY09_00155 [Crocinitomicaceae bacterium]|nr:hypothetical protein [Crocinitomicaceae bacterium]